ncbi:MAG: tetratricopeptide repeat protein [candidate division WOR-3 bacterium]|nr:tetratricopeptide repeat protein [candidate division WOR-3 bacterium]
MYYIGILIRDLKKKPFCKLVENLKKFGSKLEHAEKHLVVVSNDDINIINCLFKLRELYPEIRFGVSQYIGIAKGLSRIANIGEILISADVEPAVIENFDLTSLGMLTIEGMKSEILVCRIDGLKGVETFPRQRKFPMILPRTLMLDAFRNFLSVTKSALIFAPEGTGKTTFLDLLIEEWKDEREILRAIAPAYLSNITLKTVSDIVAQLFKIQGNFNLEEKQKLITERLKAIGIRDIGTSYLAILDFLNLGEEDTILRKMEPRARIDLIINTICDVITHVSHLKTVVIIIEDIENLDPSSVNFIQNIISKLADEDVIFVFASNRAQVNVKGVKEFELQEIDRSQIEEYLYSQTGEKINIPATTIFNVSQYLELFFEEQADYFYTLYNGENPFVNFSLPFSDNKTIIKRRLELLDENKELLYSLAVLGYEIDPQDFPISENIQEQLDHFIEHNYLRKVNDKYIFTSPILHQFIYELVPDKHTRHSRLADYYRRREGYEEYALFHYLKAENYKRAMEYLLKSTKVAMKKGGYESAVSYYLQALELCRREKDVADLETLIAINEGLADVYRSLGDEEQAMKYYKVVLDSYKEILKE